jgi:PAS domain S-box-containing protein
MPGGIALSNSEQRFKDFAKASSDWYWEMDETLRFSYFSDRFTEITGVDTSLLLGKTREETGVPDVDPDEWRRHLDALHNQRPFRNFIHPRQKPDGTTAWLSINGVPYANSDGQFMGFRGSGNDITDLVKARRDAESASRAKSDFLANMSHELRTPLNAIIGYAELLQEDARENHDRQLLDDLSKIDNAGRQLLELVNNILDISKIEANMMEASFDRVALDALFDGVADTMGLAVAKKGNTLYIENNADPSTLYTDSQKLRQILLNLLSNAAKFTTEGDIRLSVDHDGDDCLRFRVTDTGVGMSADQLGRILDPFTQADSSVAQKYGGTGLGLTITKSFAELLGGRLDVESELGKGSRFTISLPIHQVDASGVTALTA